MDKNRDILNVFKERLEDYESPVKHDIWASLENHIPQEKSLLHRIYPVAASVAAVLLVILMSYKYVFKESTDSENPVALVTESPEQDIAETVKEETKKPLPEVNADELQVYVPKGQNKKDRISHDKDLSAYRGDSVKQEDLNKEPTQAASVAPKKEDEILVVSETETQQQSSEEKTENSPHDVKRNRNLEYGNNYYTEIKTKKSSSGLQMSLSGKGFPAASNELDFLKIYNKEYLNSYDNKFEIEELFFQGETTGGDKSPIGPWLPADDYTLNKIKYHTPVTLSMYVSKNISPRWAIETGISYTMLYSEETWMAENKTFRNKISLYNDIKLHYLGIPMKASYFLIKKDRLFMYLSGGGMIEKSISGKAYTVSDDEKINKNTNIKIRELQYSVTGGVGIGVKVFRPVSLFVEPGVTYYFDDGSGIMTIRKDKPFNFNIQGGLKFHF